MSKTVFDVVHKEITLSALAVSIADTFALERMHFIKQMGNAYRVFPTSTHTRKSHSIGVYHVTKQTLDHLISENKIIVKGVDFKSLSPFEMNQWVKKGNIPVINNSEYEWICIGGLVHDIGHGPASHTFDELLKEYQSRGLIQPENNWVDHEVRSRDFFKYLVKNSNIDICKYGIDYVCNVIEPGKEYINDFRFQIVNNKVSGIDTDKMDYLVRDSVSIGLYSSINLSRIIGNSSVHYTSSGTFWTFDEKIKDEIFNLFMTRFRLYKYIYNHSKVVKFEMSYSDILKNNKDVILDCINSKNIEKFLSFTDENMMWSADKKSRVDFISRSTYTLSDDGNNDAIKVTENVGFFGKSGFNPFDHLIFYNRKTNEIVPNPNTSIFTNLDKVYETLEFSFLKNL